MSESKTKIMMRNVRLSYANIWEPKETLNGDTKYSVSLIFSKSDKKLIATVKKAIAAAKANGKSILANKKGVIPATLKLPVRDGDEERAEDSAYAGCYFLNATSINAPKIVDKKVNPIIDRSEVYSGCYANVMVNFFAYNKNGSAGISAGLGNIQKVKDGEMLGGGSNPEDDFDVIDDDDDDFDNDELNANDEDDLFD